MALVCVLIMLGLIMGIAVSVQLSSRLSLRHAERELAKARLRAAAFDAAWRSLLALQDTAAPLVTHTNEPWASPAFESLPNGMETLVVIRDEQRLFDVNNLSAAFGDQNERKPVDIAEELFEHCGCPDARDSALKLRSWLHKDGLEERSAAFPSARPKAQSSETPDNERIVESTAELFRILDFEADHDSVMSVMNVLPVRRTRPLPVNINTATPDVLRAVMGERDTAAADAICRLRNFHPLLSLDQVSNLVGAARFQACRQYLDVRSVFFSVRARAEKGRLSAEIFGLARRTDEGDIEILRWMIR